MTNSEAVPSIKDGWQGRFFEDLEIGDLYQHPLGRTITDADNVWFTLLTLNTNQIHFNDDVGRASEFGRPLVVSTLTIAVAIGQSVTDTTQNAFANLGVDKLALTHPVFVGDTLYSESLVLAKRASASRPHAGIATVKTHTLNQHGDEVLHFERTFYLYRRAAAPAHRVFPTAKTPLRPTTTGSRS